MRRQGGIENYIQRFAEGRIRISKCKSRTAALLFDVHVAETLITLSLTSVSQRMHKAIELQICLQMNIMCRGRYVPLFQEL